INNARQIFHFAGKSHFTARIFGNNEKVEIAPRRVKGGGGSGGRRADNDKIVHICEITKCTKLRNIFNNAFVFSYCSYFVHTHVLIIVFIRLTFSSGLRSFPKIALPGQMTSTPLFTISGSVSMFTPPSSSTT